MEVETIFSGIGGQGLQLIAKALALTALEDGRYVQIASEYGGAMRGGHSMAVVAIGTAPLLALPVVTAADAAVVMHRSFWDGVAPRLRPGALVVVNSSLFADDLPVAGEVVRLPATDIAASVASPMAAGFVMLGALAATTGIVDILRLQASVEQIVPPYRRQHIEANQRLFRQAPMLFRPEPCHGRP